MPTAPKSFNVSSLLFRTRILPTSSATLAQEIRFPAGRNWFLMCRVASPSATKNAMRLLRQDASDSKGRGLCTDCRAGGLHPPQGSCELHWPRCVLLESGLCPRISVNLPQPTCPSDLAGHESNPGVYSEIVPV